VVEDLLVLRGTEENVVCQAQKVTLAYRVLRVSEDCKDLMVSLVLKEKEGYKELRA
jgi:hypothetical protein